jgi:uncharacterized RDD family membrane protein YckC
MSSPPGERHAAPSPPGSGAGGDTGAASRRRRVDTAHPGRIPPQTTVTVAPENTSLVAAGDVGHRPPVNGSVRPALSSVRPAPVPVPGVAPSPPGHAGVVTRLLAAAVDTVAVVVVAALLDLGAAGARFLWSPVNFRWPQPTTFVVVVVLLVVAVVYLAAGWALAGRTYGAKLMGLRVLSSRYELLGWIRSVLRALVCVLWPVGLLWCGVSRTRRSVADLVVRTVVVYDAGPYAGVRGP